jgi:hypothetical protein
MVRDLSGNRDHPTGSNNVVVLQRTFLGGLNMVGVDGCTPCFAGRRRRWRDTGATGLEAFLGLQAIFSFRSWSQPWQFFNKILLLPGCDLRQKSGLVGKVVL